MTRCFCACHEHPGTYGGGYCGYCQHDNSQGSFPAGIRDGWQPNTADALAQQLREYVARAEALAAENTELRELIWTLTVNRSSNCGYDYTGSEAACDVHGYRKPCPWERVRELQAEYIRALAKGE